MVPPVGLVGKFNTSALLLGVTAFSMAAAVTEKAFSGRQETATGTPPARAMPGAIADVARFVIDHFVAGVDDGAEGQIHRLAHPHSDEDFARRVVGNLEMLGGRWRRWLRAR